MINKKNNAEELIERFIEYATIEGETKLSGDFRRGNAMAKKINKICKVLSSDPSLAENVLKSIMESDSFRASTMAAVECLRMNILIDEAVEILEKGSERNDILGGGCYYALKIWRGEVPNTTL